MNFIEIVSLLQIVFNFKYSAGVLAEILQFFWGVWEWKEDSLEWVVLLVEFMVAIGLRICDLEAESRVDSGEGRCVIGESE